MSISSQRRQDIIDALRRGTVPQYGLDALAVGLSGFEAAFEKRAASPVSVVKESDVVPSEVLHTTRNRICETGRHRKTQSFYSDPIIRFCQPHLISKYRYDA